MAPQSSSKVRRVCPRLTHSQKAECRRRQQELADDLNVAKDSYEMEACDLAQKHGR